MWPTSLIRCGPHLYLKEGDMEWQKEVCLDKPIKSFGEMMRESEEEIDNWQHVLEEENEKHHQRTIKS